MVLNLRFMIVLLQTRAGDSMFLRLLRGQNRAFQPLETRRYEVWPGVSRTPARGQPSHIKHARFSASASGTRITQGCDSHHTAVPAHTIGRAGRLFMVRFGGLTNISQIAIL